MSTLVDDMSDNGILVDEPHFHCTLNLTSPLNYNINNSDITTSQCNFTIVCSSCSLPFHQHTKCMSKACIAQQEKEQPGFDVSWFFNFKWWKF